MVLITYNHGEKPLIKYHKHKLLVARQGVTTIMAGDQWTRTGCGKSYTSVRLGELIDPGFSIDKVVYSPREYLTAMDKIEESGEKGQVVVVDEGEVTASSAMWQSFRNKAIGYNLATGRYLQCMSIFVSPTFGWLDKRIRVLADHFGTTSKVVGASRKPIVKLRYYRIATSQVDDRIWFKKISMFNRTSRQINTFKEFKINLPNEELIAEYEKKALNFKKGLRKELLHDLGKLEKQEEGKAFGERIDFQTLMTKALQKPSIRKMLVEKGKVTNNLLRNELADDQLSYNQGSQLKSLIEMTWTGKKV